MIGTEIYTFIHCLECPIPLAHDLSSILQRKVKTLLYTKSKCLLDTLTKLSTVLEKRMLIDIAGVSETYTNVDSSNVANVSSNPNTTNVLTRAKANMTMLQANGNKRTLSHH